MRCRQATARSWPATRSAARALQAARAAARLRCARWAAQRRATVRLRVISCHCAKHCRWETRQGQKNGRDCTPVGGAGHCPSLPIPSRSKAVAHGGPSTQLPSPHLHSLTVHDASQAALHLVPAEELTLCSATPGSQVCQPAGRGGAREVRLQKDRSKALMHGLVPPPPPPPRPAALAVVRRRQSQASCLCTRRATPHSKHATRCVALPVCQRRLAALRLGAPGCCCKPPRLQADGWSTRMEDQLQGHEGPGLRSEGMSTSHACNPP